MLDLPREPPRWNIAGAQQRYPHFLSNYMIRAKMSRVEKPDKKTTNEKPVSLHGVDFKELMRAFLKVKPKAEKKPKKKASK
ncbi:MAG: hypothetical protein KIS80_07330 [Anaerolineales bacterium]|nr:hypothetical protein [Anaerolineales bacterium]